MAEPSILIKKFSPQSWWFYNTSVPCYLSSCCKPNPHYSKVFSSSNESMLNVFYIKYQMVASAGVGFLCGRSGVCDSASNKKCSKINPLSLTLPFKTTGSLCLDACITEQLNFYFICLNIICGHFLLVWHMGSHPGSPLLQSTSLVAKYSLKDHHYWEKYRTTVTLPNLVKS